MNYVFQFGDVWAARGDLLWGAWLTIQLSASAMVLGLLVAVICALGKTMGPKPIRWVVEAYIEVIRNTPFLIQIFIIFFGLPRAGVFLSSNQAALLAMVVNVGAYATEIVRAGIESISRGQIEAGLALGLRPLQVFRYVILFPALSTVYPALSSQFILLMLELQRRLDDFGAGTDGHRERPAGAHLPQLRDLHRGHRDVPGAVDDVLRPRSVRSIARCSRARGTGMIRQFGPAEALFIIEAVRWTLLLSVVAFIGGGIGGLGVALARTAPPAWLRDVAAGYIQLFQGTPLLMQLFLVFFGCTVLGAGIDPLAAAAIALTLNAAAFLGEIWRGCIQAIPAGQWEAATALGMRHLARMRYVILPQAGKIAIAPTVGFLVLLVKSTSLASIIGFVEITRAGQIINNVTFRPFVVFGLVANDLLPAVLAAVAPEPDARTTVRHRVPLSASESGLRPATCRSAPSSSRSQGDVE